MLKPKHLVLSVFILLAVINPVQADSQPVDPKILHIINRLSFGPRPGDITKVEHIGIEAYIQEQLTPEQIVEPASLSVQLSQLDALAMTPVQLRDYATTIGIKEPTAMQKSLSRIRSNQLLQQAVQGRLLRAIHSPRQLQEVMVDFWYNHFNVDASKGVGNIWVGAYEQQAIRPFVLGRFRDLLGATAHHPAMLHYLDNSQNRVIGGKTTPGKISQLNENYARELMELHTLGVDGGYTQRDVTALAKILSGWGIIAPNKTSNHIFGFEFYPKNHDFSDKVFLKQKIKGSGKAEGELALDILAKSPATARHISYKLAQYFVSDRPPTSLVKRLSQTYLTTDGNIRAVLNTLFRSPEFWDAKNINNKFKTPYQYAISSVRATGVEVKNVSPIVNILQQLGMPVYRCPTPDGYKNTQGAWLNADGMTRRLNFATAIANGSLPFSSSGKKSQANIAKPLDSEILAQTLGNYFSTKTQNAIASSPQNIRSALILGSPEFMRR
jgi:uncharacterized protein (DUF1800 family)